MFRCFSLHEISFIIAAKLGSEADLYASLIMDCNQKVRVLLDTHFILFSTETKMILQAGQYCLVLGR